MYLIECFILNLLLHLLDLFLGHLGLFGLDHSGF